MEEVTVGPTTNVFQGSLDHAIEVSFDGGASHADRAAGGAAILWVTDPNRDNSWVPAARLHVAIPGEWRAPVV